MNPNDQPQENAADVTDAQQQADAADFAQPLAAAAPAPSFDLGSPQDAYNQAHERIDLLTLKMSRAERVIMAMLDAMAISNNSPVGPDEVCAFRKILQDTEVQA
jgi:hypothetical protein